MTSFLFLILSNNFLKTFWVRLSSNFFIFVSTTGKAPYSSVLTHGFVLDEKGLKMSKSMGNVVDPRSVIEGGKNQKASYMNV